MGDSVRVIPRQITIWLWSLLSLKVYKSQRTTRLVDFLQHRQFRKSIFSLQKMATTMTGNHALEATSDTSACDQERGCARIIDTQPAVVAMDYRNTSSTGSINTPQLRGGEEEKDCFSPVEECLGYMAKDCSCLACWKYGKWIGPGDKLVEIIRQQALALAWVYLMALIFSAGDYAL